MKKHISLSFIISFLIFLFIVNVSASSQVLKDTSGGWKAGVARVVITPDQLMWMAGYSARKHPAEGIIHDLWAKALALEDMKGNKALLITTDLESFPKYMSDRIRNRIKDTFGLTRAQIILNSSHTHSGPVIQGMYNIYTDDPKELENIRSYSVTLEEKIITLVGEAIKSMVPVQLYAQNGITRFQVNRRNNNEATLNTQTELHGPNDYAVPVLKVTDTSGNLIAVAFGYACHNTTLMGYQWCGDYAGFAQIELEKLHPGVTAMFFQGAGADQNPLPRGSVPLAQQYGRSLAAATDRVLNEDMRKLSPVITSEYSEIDLDLDDPMSKEKLSEIVEKTSDYQKHWAENLLNKIERGEPIRSSYPYPVQIWKLGDQPIISLGGELVIDYAIEFKRIFGQDIFVMGYSNDVMAYIPSAAILKEGGYEGMSSQIAFGLPAVWKSNIETLIIGEVLRLARKAEIPEIGRQDVTR
jgi:neutral ceramidase